MILRQNDRLNNSSAHRRMFEKLPGKDYFKNSKKST